MRGRFKPPLWPTVFTLATLSLLLCLGFWQLDRADQKQQRHSLFMRRRAAPPVELSRVENEADVDTLTWRRIRARGRYADLQVLLDNRIHNGVVGVEVLTPFELDGGGEVLVNRGWISASADRRVIPQIPVVAGAVETSGHAGPPPVTGLHLNPEADQYEHMSEHIIRVQRIDIPALNERYGLALPPLVIFLEQGARRDFARDWPAPGNEAGRHTAYAVQWFAMAVVLVVLYFFINLRDKDPS